MHVARDFDLKSWGELYLIILSIAPRDVGAAMVKIVFERANLKEKDWLAYLLLAGAGCREVQEIEDTLKQAISMSVSDLIPPQDMGMVYQLAEMGSLVLRFLSWREAYGSEETDRIVTLLGLIEDDEARPIIEEYAGKGTVTAGTIECFVRTLDYKNDQRLTEQVMGRLKARRLKFFWKDKPRKRLYVGSHGLLHYSDFLPEAGWLIFDGRGKLEMNEALTTDWRWMGRVTRLSIVSAGNFQAAKLERFKALREIDFAESFVEDAAFLSFLRRLEVMRLIDSELADWRALEYGDLDKLYIGGKSVGGSVYDEMKTIRRGAAMVFLDSDCIRGIEREEGAKFGGSDTWGVQVWKDEEVGALKEELGVR